MSEYVSLAAYALYIDRLSPEERAEHVGETVTVGDDQVRYRGRMDGQDSYEFVWGGK